MLSSFVKSNKFFAYIATTTGLILLIPLIGMHVSNSIRWTPFDFAVMGIILFGMFLVIAFAARKISGRKLAAASAGILLLFAYVWAELAVGIFFTFGN